MQRIAKNVLSFSQREKRAPNAAGSMGRSGFKDSLERGGRGLRRALCLGQFSLMCIWIFSFALEKHLPTIFADDSILSSFAKSVKLLLEILITESKNTIKWFSDNKIIVNDDKFKSIIIQKSNSKKQ